jgi:hypothetical protein
VLKPLSHALALSLIAAFAVDFGFRSKFISEPVAYLTTLYCCALVALLVGGSELPWPRRVALRLPVALICGSLSVVSLRSWARIPLDIGHGTTTGHWPYAVLPVAALLSALTFLLLEKIPRRV